MDIVQSLKGAKYVMSVDGVQGYYQCPLHPDSYKYAAILHDSVWFLDGW